jgi:hypothetical protein
MDPGIQILDNRDASRILGPKLGSAAGRRMTSIRAEDAVFNIIEAVDSAADVVAVDLPEPADFHGRFGNRT